MRDDFARMHNEYLDPDRYFGNQEQPVQLHEDKTLKGFGRCGHGLNGKDADLDESGQIVINSAYWFSDDTIRIEGSRYADVCPPLCCQNNENDECWDIATDIMANAGINIEAEWSDDYWYLTDGKFSLTTKWEWNDDESEEENIRKATRAALDAVTEDSLGFERTIAELHQQLDELGKEHEERIKQARTERKITRAARRK